MKKQNEVKDKQEQKKVNIKYTGDQVDTRVRVNGRTIHGLSPGTEFEVTESEAKKLLVLPYYVTTTTKGGK